MHIAATCNNLKHAAADCCAARFVLFLRPLGKLRISVPISAVDRSELNRHRQRLPTELPEATVAAILLAYGIRNAAKAFSELGKAVEESL